MSTEKIGDVIILGGGVLGFSIAYHLAKEGIASQVIEMDAIGAKASGKADGMIGSAVGMFFYAGSSYSVGGTKRTMVTFGGESYRRFQQLHLELQESCPRWARQWSLQPMALPQDLGTPGDWPA